MYMAQINLHVTEEFAEALRRLMRARGFSTKSEAIRTAVREGLEREERSHASTDFSTLIGIAKGRATGRKPRFRTDDDLWGDR